MPKPPVYTFAPMQKNQSCTTKKLTPPQQLYTFAPMKKQLQLLPKPKTDHGGSLPHPQKRKRPLARNLSMHMVLRSSKARGSWSFLKHQEAIENVLNKFAKKYQIQILNHANVGNHIHLHLKTSTRVKYRAFIRAITSSIRSLVTGYSRWKPAPDRFYFWDLRPWSRLLISYQEYKNLTKYIGINQLEALGLSRRSAINYVNEIFRRPALE